MSDPWRGKGRTEGWGCKWGIHYTEHWLDGGRWETLVSTEIRIPSERVVESSSSKIIVLAPNQIKPESMSVRKLRVQLRGEVKWVQGLVACCVFPLLFTAHTHTYSEALCAHRKLYPCWLNGFCSLAFSLLFSIFSINYLLALCFCMLNILGAAHLCSLYSWVPEYNFEMWLCYYRRARQDADCNQSRN